MSEELLPKLPWIAVGGALGAVSRFFVAHLSLRHLPATYPWGTTLANLVGALLFGFVWAVAERTEMAQAWRYLLLTGFLGAFTTFSTFMFETVHLLSGQRPLMGLVNILFQCVVGIGCVYLGMWGGRAT